MKKKLKKSLACLLAALLIFSSVPMSALADEAVAPVTVTDEITAVGSEKAAAPDTEPDSEPTATPEASAKPSAEPTAEPSPEVTEEPAEPETSAEPEATAEPTASPTPNPEDGISLLALGDEAITRYRTVGINGNFSSNYLYDLGQYPLYDILLNGTSYPAYCLQHGKGRVNNGAYVQRDNYGMTEAMRRIVAYGFNNTNSLQDGSAGWYSAATAKMMVTQHLVWLASEGYITVNGTNWSWGSGIDTDVERMANLAYNGSVVRSYYAELKDRLLRSEIVPSFAGKNSDGSDAQEIDLQLVNGKYTATVTDTNGVLDLFDFQLAGFDISRNGNTLTISASTLPEQETTIIGAGYTVGDKNSIAVWEDRDQQANIQHQATCPGTTQTMAYIKIKGEKPKYTVTLTKTSADVKITNGNANYSLEGAVYNVYKAYVNPNHDYTNDPVVATFTTQKDGHATLSKKLENGDYVTIEQVAPLGYTLDTSVHRFSVDGKNTDIPVVDDPGRIRLIIRKKDSTTGSSTASGNASLAGAIYRVSYLENGATTYKDITTNSAGVADLRDIPLGLVSVQEISSPAGYKLDTRVHTYEVHPSQTTPITSPWRSTSRAGNTVQASYKVASKTAYRSTSEAVSHAARAGAQAAQQAAKTATVETVKATATVSAGAATAGTSVAVQAAAETAKKVTVGTVQKIQESAQTATAVHAHDMARAAQQHVANKTKDVPATDAKGLPKILMAIWIGMVVLLLVFSNSFGSLASSAGRAINLNDRVESYRASITYWAQKDGIPEYVEVLLALCMAETGILDDPGDPFACSESGLAVKQPNGITDPEYSIEIGVYCFSLKVKKTGCKLPADKNNLFKALQAYNMGDGFIDFCNTYYGGVWSVECARAYSEKMGGGSTYGNPNYIEQFLRCYTFGTISGTYPGSLNAHGLCAPLEPGWEQNITQHFGGMYSGSPHKGMDIGMPEGTPVYAAADGKVTVANASDSWGYSWGYYVKINHAEGVDTLYAHLSGVAVSYGQYVHQGDVIGYVGSTGNSSGNHLHFELYLENNRVDPYPYIGTDLLSKYLERVF